MSQPRPRHRKADPHGSDGSVRLHTVWRFIALMPLTAVLVGLGVAGVERSGLLERDPEQAQVKAVGPTPVLTPAPEPEPEPEPEPAVQPVVDAPPPTPEEAREQCIETGVDPADVVALSQCISDRLGGE